MIVYLLIIMPAIYLILPFGLMVTDEYIVKKNELISYTVVLEIIAAISSVVFCSTESTFFGIVTVWGSSFLFAMIIFRSDRIKDGFIYSIGLSFFTMGVLLFSMLTDSDRAILFGCVFSYVGIALFSLLSKRGYSITGVPTLISVVLLSLIEYVIVFAALVYRKIGHDMVFLTAVGTASMISVVFMLVRVFEKNRSEERQRDIIGQYHSDLKEICDDINLFRHNYINTIVAMDGCYREKDYEKLGEILACVTKEMDDVLVRHQYNVVSQIEDTALRWLIASKLPSVRRYGINLSLMVFGNVNYGSLKSYNFNSILGAFMDNAIEAAKDSDKKYMKLTICEENGDTLLSVKNTYCKKPKMSMIFEQNYSEKQGHSGIGLYGVKKIVDAHDDAFLDLRVTEEYFIADLNILKQIKQRN